MKASHWWWGQIFILRKWTMHSERTHQRANVLLASVIGRHWADHEFDSVWHPLSQTESQPLNQERIWVKFRRTKHHNFFFLSAKARPLLGAMGNLRVEFIWSVDSLTNCTQSKAKQRGWPLFLYSSVLILSCPLGQYPAWSEQQEMTQNHSLGGR